MTSVLGRIFDYEKLELFVTFFFFFASHFLRLCGASNNARATCGLGLGQDRTDGIAISDKIIGSIEMSQDIYIEVELWGGAGPTAESQMSSSESV